MMERYEIEKKTMANILTLLPKDEAHIWTDGEEILCDNQQTAETLADFIDALYGEQTVNTGYYDPAEDERNNEVTRSTGYYYVTIN